MALTTVRIFEPRVFISVGTSCGFVGESRGGETLGGGDFQKLKRLENGADFFDYFSHVQPPVGPGFPGPLSLVSVDFGECIDLVGNGCHGFENLGIFVADHGLADFPAPGLGLVSDQSIFEGALNPQDDHPEPGGFGLSDPASILF